MSRDFAKSPTIPHMWSVSPHRGAVGAAVSHEFSLRSMEQSSIERLEPGQVLTHLPRSHLLVVAAPLVPLDADEVVDVVLVTGPSEGVPQHVVALELVRRLEQVRRQRVEAARLELVVRER